MPEPLQEDTALDLLVMHLRANGYVISICGRPDREGTSRRTVQLTVDAVVKIDGERFAVDVLRATWEESEMAGRRSWGKNIRPLIEEVASEEAVECTGVARPPYPAIAQRRNRERFIESCRSAMRKVLADGQAHQVGDTNIIIQTVRQNPNRLTSVHTHFTAYNRIDPTVSVNDSVKRATGKTVAKKLAGQLAAARRQGLKTALLIDQRDSSGNWVAHADLYVLAIQKAIESSGEHLDAAWLITAGGRVAELVEKRSGSSTALREGSS